MKQKLLLTIALLCAVAQGVWAQNVVDLSQLEDCTDITVQNGDVLTGKLIGGKIAIPDGATVTFRNITLSPHDYRVGGHSTINCEGNATIILEEGTKNSVVAYGGTAIFIGTKDKTLTIKGSGSLYAKGGEGQPGIGGANGNIVIDGGIITAEGTTYLGSLNQDYAGAAGIGSKNKRTFGNITINGGTITAYGSYKSPGIGPAAMEGECGSITINGGTIKAYGGEYGAGIGGGDGHHGGSITINGGTIEAKGGKEGAGIGGGEDGSGGDIHITGGTVTATGGEYAAGIGGGDGASGGAIWIDGGDVKAYGGKDAAGIGGGEGGNSGSIVINGGNVYASGSGYGVGIGAGEDGDVDNTISINGGTVEAFGGDNINRAIGGEDDEDYSNISIDSKMKVTDASTFGSTLSFAIRGLFLSSYYHLKFEPCDHAGQTLSYTYVDDNKHKFMCQWCGLHEEGHTGELSCTKCDYTGTPNYVHYYELVLDEQSWQYKYQVVAINIFKSSVILPELSSPVPPDLVFVGWVNGSPEVYYDDGMLLANEQFYSPGYYYSGADKLPYFRARYVKKTLDLSNVGSDQTIYDGVVLTGTLDTKNYPVKITIANNATVTLRDANISGVNNADFKWAGLTCEGNATIILEGKNTVKGFYENYPGIYVPANYTLTIKGTGSLDASSNGYGTGIGSGYGSSIPSAGSILIQGGNITATGGKYAAGIGSSHSNSCDNILISGGTINATGGEYAAAIGSGWGGNGNAGDYSSCGTVTISSGVTSVTATKGDYAPYSIGAGYNGTCTSVNIFGKVGAISESPYIFCPSLDVSGDMTSDLEAAMGNVFDISFRGRKFIIDSEWNTLCLPFSMTAEQIGNSPLANGRIMELDTEKTTLNDGVLTIAYKTATEIVAGKPYMVKWIINDETAGHDIDNPIFKGVTISASAPTAVSAAGITFTGTFAPSSLANGDKTKLWLDDDVRLRWASGQNEQVNPTWCYWNLGNMDASTLNAIVVTFDDGSHPIVELMDGMTDFSILSAFGNQEVNASLEGRELSAVQQADGTWQSRAYTVCLPFYAELFGTGSDFSIYSKAEITQDGELLFTEEMLPFLYPGNAYLIVVNEGTLRLQEEAVTLTAEAKEADDDSNAVLLNYVDEQIAGYWLGSLKTIGHDEAMSRKAFTLASDGSFQRITDEHPTWKWPAYRAMFCATDLMTADKLTTKYQLDANGVEDEEVDRSLPAPDNYQGDNDGEATAIAPVIRTIDRDGTERWFDLSGRQLEGKPTQKGVYINKGKKAVIK